MSAEELALSQPLTASEVTNGEVAAVNFWSSSSVVLAYGSDNGDVSEIDLTWSLYFRVHSFRIIFTTAYNVRANGWIMELVHSCCTMNWSVWLAIASLSDPKTSSALFRYNVRPGASWGDAVRRTVPWRDCTPGFPCAESMGFRAWRWCSAWYWHFSLFTIWTVILMSLPRFDYNWCGLVDSLWHGSAQSRQDSSLAGLHGNGLRVNMVISHELKRGMPQTVARTMSFHYFIYDM